MTVQGAFSLTFQMHFIKENYWVSGFVRKAEPRLQPTSNCFHFAVKRNAEIEHQSKMDEESITIFANSVFVLFTIGKETGKSYPEIFGAELQ